MPTSSGKFLTLTGLAIAPQGLRKWGVTDTGDKLDETAADSLGVVQSEVGCVDYEVTIEVYMRTPTSIKAGSFYRNLVLFQEAGVTPADYSFSCVKVMRAAKTVEVRGQKLLTLTLAPAYDPSTGVPCLVTVGGA